MAGPLLLSDNLYNTIAYPSHIITADEEATGHEIENIADGRRSQYDYYTSVTANTERTLKVDCGSGVTRQVNCLFLDRGHNLTGEVIVYEDSTDGAAWNTRVTITIPTSGVDLTSANGAVMEDGAFGKVWSAFTATRYHRLRIPAMGTGLIPVVVGAWLGMSYQPTYFYNPWSEDGATFTRPGNTTEWGWRGGGPSVVTRDGTLNLKLDSAADYTTARPFLVKQFAAGRPMWICHDQAQADRTILAMFPDGARIDPRFDSGWFPRQVQIPYVEHEPKRA